MPTMKVALALPTIHSANHGWNSSPNTQYHIQTDEGPERYFRYQTISGQYRKEKRLEDGTVIGTTGWVDADGFLHLQNYIADNQGYRILKTKNVFVGRNRDVQQAVTASKSVPATAGVLVSPKQRPTTYFPPKTIYSTPSPDNYISITPKVTPIGIYNTPPPPISLAEYGSKLSTSRYTTPAPSISYTTTPVGIYSSTPVPREPFVEVSPNSIASTTVSPPITSTPLYITSTPAPSLSSTTSRPVTSLSSNDLDGYTSDLKNPYVFQNGPTYPVDKNGNTYNGYTTNQIGNGYDPQFPYYDGVAVTNDGFRYYLPRQYHEEQNVGAQRRSGSFGYIDPFGIRRVIYYNTAPGTGFQHRKNNRYVGFDATPYDPRPYRK